MSLFLDRVLLSIIFCLGLSSSVFSQNKVVSPVDLVDMMMGQKGESNCVIGPQTPHGSINPSPQTPGGGHDGYNPQMPIRGFGQLHVSGTGWGRYGQILISPQTGFVAREDGHDSPKSEEIASPYYYKVRLDRYNILTELSPTKHSAIYRFTYPASDSASVLLDLAHNIPMHIAPEVKGRFCGGKMFIDPDKHVIKGWGSYAGGYGDAGTPYMVYFYAEFNKSLLSYEIQRTFKGVNADTHWARLSFKTTEGEALTLKIAISMKSIDNAKEFLKAEIPGYDFEQVKNSAKECWNSVLGKINIITSDSICKRTFYTAFYHSQLMPRDRSSDNPNWTNNEPYFDDHFDIWDTWRTKFPLMVLLDQDYVARNIRSFIDRLEHNRDVKPGFISGLDMDMKQGGDDVDNVIADAYVKGVAGVDWGKAWKVLSFNAEQDRSPNYLKNGWQVEDGAPMSCSNSLEFAYNDFCAAQMAKGLGLEDAYKKYITRSQNWEKLFDPKTCDNGYCGFIRPRKADLAWVDFDPRKNYYSWNEFFYESNSWTYSLFIPHQFNKLVALGGGKEQFAKRLNYGFQNNLIWLDNEPGFLAPFIFIYCGRPDMTSYWVDRIRDERFSLEKGYPGNEDSGAMGSWYVFTTLGLFPNAGQDIYYLVSPAVEKSKITLWNGKNVNIWAKNLSARNKIIKSVTVNGKPWNKAWIRHSDLVNGASIVFEMGDKAEGWGKTQLPSDL
ncbi:MAG: GH92 family glycosyl hydrolase [Bacteroidota bacterium]|nr:GH92 family glycosyl hydrolase [Bacteroidota bacterium]